jgi:hypothetical protein
VTVQQTIRLLACAGLAVSLAGAVWSGAALVYEHRVRHLAVQHRELFWRLVGVKVAGIALFTVNLAAHIAR